MGDFKIKPPAPLIRSNTTHAGTLSFKRHHIPHHSLHHHNYHDETSHSRVRVASEQEMDDPRDASFSSIQPTSRKGSSQVEMSGNQERRPSLPAEQLEVSTAVRDLQETSKQQMLRLATTYSSVSKKLNEIRLMSEQLKQLGKAAEDVLQEFDAGSMDCRREFTVQIKGIERFREEDGSIEKLQERLNAEKEKVQTYRKRLEDAQEKIDKQKEMEVVWRQRASRRLRFLWGFISILVILWLLATAGNEAEFHEVSVGLQVIQVDQNSIPDTAFLHDGASCEL